MNKLDEIQLVAALRLAYQQGAKDCLDLALDAVEHGEHFGADVNKYYKNRLTDCENDFIQKTMKGAT